MIALKVGVIVNECYINQFHFKNVHFENIF